MAYERKTALNRVRSIQTTLAIHMVKVMIFDAPDVMNHWLNEINGYLLIANDTYIKPRMKKLSGDEYYKLLWDEPFGHGAWAIDKKRESIFIKNNYEKLPRRNITDALIYERLEKFYHMVSYDIANNKKVNIRNYLNILGI